MLAQKFEEQVKKTPHNLAVKTIEREYTYLELNRCANGIAQRITAAAAGETAALLFEHGVHMIAAILGALKAGKVYVPLSTDYPVGRLSYMLSDSGAAILLTDTLNLPMAQELSRAKAIPVINIDSGDLPPDADESDPARDITADKPAYILYTSGSTGRPKGVLQTHENADYYNRSWVRKFSITASDRMTLFSSFCHDGSVQDMYSALHSGAALFPVNMKSPGTMVKLSEFLLTERITIWHSVPSLFTFFANTLDGSRSFPDLRFILLGGEAVREHEVEICNKYFPHIKLANVYGQTESSVNAIHIFPQGGKYKKPLLGTPLDKTRLFVVNEGGDPVKTLQTGEILVACRYISPGYWKNPEATEEIFDQDEELGRIYWTGDLGRLLMDGGIEFLGRGDSQVKIRGFRVEVGEIETWLFQHKKVKEAVVLAKADDRGDTYLCAYVVPHKLDTGEEDVLTISGIREFLSKELPDYMVPSYLVQLKEMPLTQSNKIDRKRLPEPGHHRPQLEAAYVAPGNSLENDIAAIWKDVLKLDKVGINDNFFDLGGTSFDILKAADGLQEILGSEVPIVNLFRYPTVSALTAYLNQPEQGGEPVKTIRKRKFLPPSSQVAVIGMAGRFPGAKNISEFWGNLKKGVESISFFTPEELESRGVDPRLARDPAYVGAFGVLDGIEYFDAHFFSYVPAEAQMMDPQMRLLHECCWEALENAGYNADSYDGLIGLYAGNAPNHYWVALTYLNRLDGIDTGFLNSNYSTKVSYKLNLSGPSFMVQAACSTSLLAVHVACRSLVDGECDMALAGGVSVSLPDKEGYLYREGMILSPDGHCRVFDAEAGGMVFGNGAGIVVLKRLEDAVAGGDTIRAVIKGSAVNNDGSKKVGVTAPSVEGQAEVIRAAHELAQVEPESITYVETHGTATILGDPIEIEALKLAFGTGKKGYCSIGSVKSNIGHLNVTSGAAGLIKTVLSLQHKVIPASLHYNNPNPKIDFENSPFYVNTRLREWQGKGSPLRAGVNSFGIGGTNVHVVLEEWDEANCKIQDTNYKQNTSSKSEIPNSVPRQPLLSPDSNTSDPSYPAPQLLVLSARTQLALDKMSENLVGHIKENPGVNLTDAAYTLQVGRKAFRYRKMMVCPGADEIDLLLTSPVSLAEEGDKPVIFIFAGQGNQYIDMGLDLYRAEKDFREEVDRCFEIANSITGYNLKEILYPGLSRMSTSPRFGKGESGPVQGDAAEVGSPGNPAGNATLSLASPGLDIDAHIGDTGFSQPLIFIIEYALARLLIKKGIKPAAMIGYSLGEYIAACLSGVFSLKDALKLVVGRGKLARETAPAVMLNVPLPGEEMEPLLPEDLSLAIASDPTSVVTGPPAAIESFEKKMKERRLLCGRIDIAHAFHSPLMEPIRGKLEKAFAGLTLNSPQLPYISNVSGDWITPREAVDPQYWGRHLCSTVRFSKGINKLLEMENAVFIEIGPGRMLGNIVRQQKKAKPSQLILNVLRHRDEKTPDDYYFLKRIGQLWGYGLKIDWGRFHTVEKRRRIPLPTYPFEKQRYWLEGNPFKIGQVGAEAGQQPGDASTAVVGGKKIPAAKIPVPLHSRPELSSTYTAPVTGTEKTLAGIWRDLLHLEEVGVYDDFFELGGDSLKVTAFRGRIHRETGIDVVLSEFFSRPTIRQIAGYIDESRDKKSFCRIEPVESKDYYPLSDAQTRLFILQQVESANVSYNLPFVVFLEGILDKDRVETSFGKVINRHETFRTGFFIVDEQPVQRIHSPGDMDFKIEFEKKPKLHHSSSGIKKLVLEFIRPFDLSQAPLLRIGLIAIRENKHLLMVDMHHIITDAFSHNILVEDFVSFYSGEELAPLKLQYKDYVEWRNRREEKQKTLEQEAYWLKQLAGPLPVLDLPTDFVRPESQGFEGGRIGFSIGREKLDSLRETTLKENVTMHMLMLAILYVLLARLSGQEDIIIGTPIAGRNHPDVENIIGLFVNTLVQRNYPGRGKGFPDFLKEVKQNSLDAYENQDYPFDDLVKKLVKERDNSRNPLFDVMFEMQKIDAQQQQGMGKVGEFELKPYKREITTTLVDMDWVGRESEDNIYFTITYCTKLFREETVVFTADCFQVLIDSIIEKPGSKIKDLDYTLMEKELSTKEETKIEFNF